MIFQIAACLAMTGWGEVFFDTDYHRLNGLKKSVHQWLTEDYQMRDKQIKDLKKSEIISEIRGKEYQKKICENLCNLREKGRLPDEKQIDKRLKNSS